MIYEELKHKKCGLGEDEDFKALRNLVEICAIFIYPGRMPLHKGRRNALANFRSI